LTYALKLIETGPVMFEDEDCRFSQSLQLGWPISRSLLWTNLEVLGAIRYLI
jgi:hypothetical protein